MRNSTLPGLAIALVLVGVMAVGCPAKDGTTPSSNSPPPPPPKPAEYVVSDLTLPSGAILAGSPISVAVTIQNIGEVSGTYNVVLKVEGADVDNQELTLAGGVSETVSFSIAVDTGGSYEASVGDISGTFEILPVPFSNTVLTLDDLPAGFAVSSVEELLGMSPDDAAEGLQESGAEFFDFFSFISAESMGTFEIVIGLNGYSLNVEDQARFDEENDNTDDVAAGFGLTTGGNTLLEMSELTGLSDIGDKSNGLRFKFESEGIVMVMEAVEFRNGEVGSLLLVIWLDGYTPLISTEELVNILADKTATAVASSIDPFTVMTTEEVAVLHYDRGVDLAEQGWMNHAIYYHSMALELNPDYVEAYYKRGSAYSRIGKYDMAIADCTRAIALDPNCIQAYNNRGNTYNRQGDYEKAIADYDKAIEIDPNYTKAYCNRGLTYWDQGEYDQALADYTKAIELDPNYAKAYYGRGNTYGRQGEYDKAIADFTRAIEIDPNYAMAYYGRGLTYAYKGEFDKAIADLETCISLSNDPSVTQAAQQLLADIS